ncbi:MAG: hypothetical protein ABIY55_07415 [Kofleriaceae bacterium]
MRSRLTTSILLSAAALTACGDDVGNSVADAALIDVRPPVDGLVIGDSPGPVITDPEGGNVILEHMTLDTELQMAFHLPAGVKTQTRVIAYFMSAMTPNANPLPSAGVCTNLATTKGWPAYVGSPHTDIDVGTLTLKGKNAAGADVSIAVTKQGVGSDQIGRPHDVFYQLLQPTVDDLLKSDSSYSVQFGGVAGGMPATTFQDAIYLSADYADVQNPSIEDNGPLIAGTDYPVAWTPPVPVNRPPPSFLVGGDVLGATWLLDMSGAPTHVCIVPASVGHFTIPGAAITEFKIAAGARGQQIDKLIILRNAIAHKLARLPSTDAANQRRIDMVSLACWAQVMDVQ